MSFRDVRLRRATVMHLEVLVGAAVVHMRWRPGVCQPCTVKQIVQLSGRQTADRDPARDRMPLSTAPYLSYALDGRACVVGARDQRAPVATTRC
jgi:hypothetical protein